MSKPVTTNCPYCGNLHQTLCPRIKKIEYNQDGTQKSVEFMTPSDYQQIPNYNIWPDRRNVPPIFEGPIC